MFSHCTHCVVFPTVRARFWHFLFPKVNLQNVYLSLTNLFGGISSQISSPTPIQISSAYPYHSNMSVESRFVGEGLLTSDAKGDGFFVRRIGRHRSIAVYQIDVRSQTVGVGKRFSALIAGGGSLAYIVPSSRHRRWIFVARSFVSL